MDKDVNQSSKLPKYMTLQKRKEDLDLISYRPVSSTEKSQVKEYTNTINLTT